MPSRMKAQSKESKVSMLPDPCPPHIESSGRRGWPTFTYKAEGTTQQ